MEGEWANMIPTSLVFGWHRWLSIAFISSDLTVSPKHQFCSIARQMARPSNPLSSFVAITTSNFGSATGRSQDSGRVRCECESEDPSEVLRKALSLGIPPRKQPADDPRSQSCQ